jgi:hypothetical protein
MVRDIKRGIAVQVSQYKKKSPYPKTNESKKSWGRSRIGRAPA